MEQFLENAELEEKILISCLILLKRVLYAGFRMRRSESFKVLAISLFISFKLADDEEDYWTVSDWSKIAGVTEQDIVTMEALFLTKALQFDVVIHKEEYKSIRKMIKLGRFCPDLFNCERIKLKDKRTNKKKRKSLEISEEKGTKTLYKHSNTM